MPSQLNTYGDISPRTAAYAAKELLRRRRAHAILEKFGHFDPQGMNKTKTRTWRRYEPLAAATSPIVEGVTPAGQKLRFTDVEAVLRQYGDWIPLTDVILDTHEDPILNQSIDLCSDQIVETTELVRWGVVKAGTNVYYASTATTRAGVNSHPLRGDLRKIYRGFKRNRAQEITQVLRPGVYIATEPVKASFVLLGHTDLDSDIRNMTGFNPVEKYSAYKPLDEAEIGSVEHFRVMLNDLYGPWLAAGSDTSGNTTYLTGGVSGTGNPDVYPMVAISRDAYAIVPLAGKNMVKPAVHNPTPVPGDELAQRGFVSWKMYQTAAILQDAWLARYECAATANPV